MSVELLLHGVVAVLHAVDAAEDFGKVDGDDGDTGALEQLFAVTHGVEGLRPCSERADAEVAEAINNAADGGEPGEVFTEGLGLGLHGVLRGDGVRDSILHEVIAGRHLAAEAVTAMGYLHGLFAIGRGLHEDRHLQRGIADGVGDTAFVAEVRQGYDDAVDFIAVFAEEIAAAARLFMSFDGTVLRFFRAQRDYFDAGLL